jgi:hypothetical protein
MISCSARGRPQRGLVALALGRYQDKAFYLVKLSQCKAVDQYVGVRRLRQVGRRHRDGDVVAGLTVLYFPVTLSCTRRLRLCSQLHQTVMDNTVLARQHYSMRGYTA